jgi:hypothetical protein
VKTTGIVVTTAFATIAVGAPRPATRTATPQLTNSIANVPKRAFSPFANRLDGYISALPPSARAASVQNNLGSAVPEIEDHAARWLMLLRAMSLSFLSVAFSSSRFS